jgi:hypothetical protein
VAHRCSGTVVDTPNKSMVLTAARCLYRGGAWAANVRFVPAHNDGAAPFGTWPATTIVVLDQWVTDDRNRSPSVAWDVGVILVGLKAKKTLGQTVGGGYMFGWEHPQGMGTRALGYQAWLAQSGNVVYRLSYCAGDTSLALTDLGGPPLACTMGAAATGGPWMYFCFNPQGVETPFRGFIYSLHAATYPGIAVIQGPKFNSAHRIHLIEKYGGAGNYRFSC